MNLSRSRVKRLWAFHILLHLGSALSKPPPSHLLCSKGQPSEATTKCVRCNRGENQYPIPHAWPIALQAQLWEVPMRQCREVRVLVCRGVLVTLAVACGASCPGSRNQRPCRRYHRRRYADRSDGSTKVRLAEIDTPESGQPYGSRARQALSDLAFGKSARVVAQDTDRYGRMVGRVYVGSLDVNAEMVRQGAAWVYRRYSHDASLLQPQCFIAAA
jgi:nuclease-like protein